MSKNEAMSLLFSSGFFIRYVFLYDAIEQKILLEEITSSLRWIGHNRGLEGQKIERMSALDRVLKVEL